VELFKEKRTMLGQDYKVRETIFFTNLMLYCWNIKYEFGFDVWMLIKLKKKSKRNDIIMNDVCSGDDFLMSREG